MKTLEFDFNGEVLIGTASRTVETKFGQRWQSGITAKDAKGNRVIFSSDAAFETKEDAHAFATEVLGVARTGTPAVKPTLEVVRTKAEYTEHAIEQTLEAFNPPADDSYDFASQLPKDVLR